MMKSCDAMALLGPLQRSILKLCRCSLFSFLTLLVPLYTHVNLTMHVCILTAGWVKHTFVNGLESVSLPG